MKDTKIIFMGTPEFACGILQTLIDEQYNVIAVVSQPDKPVGRKKEILETPTHALAKKYNIPVIQPIHLSKEIDSVLQYQPELIVTCAYGQYVPTKILKYPKFGCINIHPSALPKYRGGAPIHHAIWSGETSTDVCMMEMIKEMDAGRIWARCHLDIGADETTEELSKRLLVSSCDLLKENLPKYLRGELHGEIQDESQVVIGNNIKKEEEQVFFSKENVHQAYNHIRALIDWPISYGVIDNKRVKFYRASKIVKEVSELPGTLLGFQNHAMEIACEGGSILIFELQLEGKSKMTADAFANGFGRTLIGKQFI